MTRTEILRQHGITDRNEIRISTTQEKDKLWLVSIAGVGDPVKTFSTKKAQELAVQLSQIGERDLASHISAAAQKAHKANGNT
jgi:hypothetical protein